MIDTSFLFWIELCALALLVGVGGWRLYRTQRSGEINASAPVASAPVAYDMRQDGQRLSFQSGPR